MKVTREELAEAFPLLICNIYAICAGECGSQAVGVVLIPELDTVIPSCELCYNHTFTKTLDTANGLNDFD